MNNNPLITALYQIGAVQFGEFTLKSGKTSTIYINLRKIISYPAILRQIATAMWDVTKHCQYDLICGVPYTALPIATCISLDHDTPMIMRRKEKKDYGTKQMIEGEYKAGERCIIIEDIITTGSSIIETAKDLEQVGIKVTDLVALIDREQGGRENLEKQYKLYTILTLSEILTTLYQSTLLSTDEKTAIDKFREETAKST